MISKEDNFQLTFHKLAILQAIKEGMKSFTKINEQVPISKPYLSQLLDELIEDKWIYHNKPSREYVFAEGQIDQIDKYLETSFGTLPQFSKELLPLADEINSIPDPRKKTEAYRLLYMITLHMIAIDSLRFMAALRKHKTNVKINKAIGGSFAYSVPNTIRILAEIATRFTSVDNKLLLSIMDDFEKQTMKEIEELQGTTATE